MTGLLIKTINEHQLNSHSKADFCFENLQAMNTGMVLISVNISHMVLEAAVIVEHFTTYLAGRRPTTHWHVGLVPLFVFELLLTLIACQLKVKGGGERFVQNYFRQNKLRHKQIVKETRQGKFLEHDDIRLTTAFTLALTLTLSLGLSVDRITINSFNTNDSLMMVKANELMRFVVMVSLVDILDLRSR